MSTHDDEFNWRESLERLGSAALDLVTGLGARVSGEAQGPVGSGVVVTESREVSGFTRIKLAGFGTLNITQTGTESLSITADDNILPHLTSEVVDGTLELGVKPRLSFRPMKHITYTVTVNSLDGIQLTGAGTVHASGIQTQSLSVMISGAGDMTISGSAPLQTVKISGAGNYDASELQTESSEVTISGAGNARINASRTLNATVSGAGAVKYTGSPQVSQRITGIGSVRAV
ncbi:MAG TPA: head GIN domain-containing protein [Ktedonobacterales bacterium]|nr:head GIN domain-containing protein [Ktedonobacterales bacterium]